MEDIAAICVKCGVAAGQGVNFCQHCGAQTAPGAAFCTTCGAPLGQVAARPVAPAGAQPKSKMAAGLLGLFLGAYGVHNFYLGNTGRGVLQIVLTVVTCGIAGLWGFIEGIMILCGNINTDANGVPLSD
jgi:TM2 domain-containing membrane protein YozV